MQENKQNYACCLDIINIRSSFGLVLTWFLLLNDPEGVKVI